MFNKLPLILFVSTLILGCSHQSNPSVVNNTEAHKTDVNNKTIKALYLLDIVFTKQVSDGKFKSECQMLPVLQKSILDSATNLSIDISPSDTILHEQYELKVEYLTVIPHRFNFFSLRPSSSATIQASIIKAGKTLKTTTKAIASGVAFGACDRLEKISVAQGRYVSKWVLKNL